MRLHRGVPMLASVPTLVGTSTPAYAFVRPSGGGQGGQPTALTQHHSGDSTDWVVGIGAAGAVAVLGSAAGVARRRRTLVTRPARTAS
jgi:hypothetical protein